MNDALQEYWQDAIKHDDEKHWRDAALIFHGACLLAISHCDPEYVGELIMLRQIADQNRIEAIKEGKF